MAPHCLSEFQHGAWAHSLTAQRRLERRARQAGGKAQVLQTHAAGGAGGQHLVPLDDYDKASTADQRTKRVIVHGQLSSGISGRTNRCISRASLQTDHLPSAFGRPCGPTTEGNGRRTLNSALEAKSAIHLPITFRPSPEAFRGLQGDPPPHAIAAVQASSELPVGSGLGAGVEFSAGGEASSFEGGRVLDSERAGTPHRWCQPLLGSRCECRHFANEPTNRPPSNRLPGACWADDRGNLTADVEFSLGSRIRETPSDRLPTVAKAPSDRRRAPSVGDLCRRKHTHGHMS